MQDRSTSAVTLAIHLDRNGWTVRGTIGGDQFHASCLSDASARDYVLGVVPVLHPVADALARAGVDTRQEEVAQWRA